MSLSIAAVRQLNKGRWRDFVNNLTKSQMLRDQILMEDLSGIISTTRRIDLKEFEEIHMENETICQDIFGESILEDEHKNCIDLNLPSQDYDCLIEYVSEDRDYHEEYPFYDQLYSSESEDSDSELDNHINSLLHLYLNQDDWFREENLF